MAGLNASTYMLYLAGNATLNVLLTIVDYGFESEAVEVSPGRVKQEVLFATKHGQVFAAKVDLVHVRNRGFVIDDMSLELRGYN